MSRSHTKSVSLIFPDNYIHFKLKVKETNVRDVCRGMQDE